MEEGARLGLSLLAGRGPPRDLRQGCDAMHALAALLVAPLRWAGLRWEWASKTLHATARSQALVFTGEASLRVTSGRAFVNGCAVMCLCRWTRPCLLPPPPNSLELGVPRGPTHSRARRVNPLPTTTTPPTHTPGIACQGAV